MKIWPFYKKPEKKALSRFGSWVEWFSPPVTSAGISISNESALSISTVYACIRNIAEDVSKVPLKFYRRTTDGKQPVDEHPLAELLNRQPNAEMTAMDFRQAMTGHCIGWGNAYAEIARNLGGTVIGLYPLLPSKVTVRRDDTTQQIVYEVTRDDGRIDHLSAETVFHLRGLGADGIMGYNVIEYARESLGSAKAAEKFGATYFGNNTILGGILKHPTNLTEEAQSRLRNSIKSYQGPENANKVMVLEEAMTWERNMIPPEESQFLETRQFSVTEICRWFRMPPHKVADLQRATFSNIEHQDLEYVKDCLTAWFKRWETEIWTQLITAADQSTGIFAEHTVEGLLRGDINSRYGAYQIALGNNNNPGFMSINEVRALENLNPVDGGDELFSPQAEPEPEPNEEPENEEDEPDNQRDND